MQFEVGKSYYATEMPDWPGTCIIITGRNGRELDCEWPSSGRPQDPFTVTIDEDSNPESFEHNGYHYSAENEW